MAKTDARLDEFSKKMQGALEAFNKDLAGVRAGRASPNLLEPLKVDAYGAFMPITQVATITAPEPRMLVVQVWDKGLVKNVEKAIRTSPLGVEPSTEGQNIRVMLPALNDQRRQELAKLVGKYAEDARIHVRNIRREAMEILKKWEKDKQISEDEHKRLSEQTQELTDDYIKQVDTQLALKQKDITAI